MELTQKQLDSIKKQFMLSPKQIEVIKIILQGKDSTKELAEQLSVTEGVARQYIYQIHTRMRTNSKSGIIVSSLDHLISKKLL